MKKLWLTSSMIVALTGAALSQSSAVLSNRDDGSDSDFAERLFQERWVDLAQQLTNLLNAGTAGADVANVDVRFLDIEARKERAMREPDPSKRKDLLRGILNDQEKLIDDFPRHRRADQTRETLPDTFRQLGEALVAAMQKSEDPNAIGTLRDEGQKVFKQAEDDLETRIKDFKKRFEELGEEPTDPKALEAYEEKGQVLDRQREVAVFNLARMFYFHSQLYPEGEAARNLYAKKAIDQFDEFGLDYQDSLNNYQGMIYQGLAYKARGDDDAALEAFDSSIDLREFYNQDEQGRFQVEADSADVISQAALQKVLLLSERQKFTEANEAAKEFLTTIAAALDAASGKAVLAAQADALIAAGDTSGAAAAAQLLIDTDPQGPWGEKGRSVINDLGISVAQAPDKILDLAYAAFNKPNYPRALDLCHQAVAASRGSEWEIKVAPNAYMTIAAVYSKQEFGFEATQALDALVEQWPKSEQAPEALSRSIKLYQRLFKDEKRKFFRDRAQERQTRLASEYPSSEQALSIALLIGQELEDEGKLMEAAEYYLGLPKGSTAYFEAQVRAGNCYLRKGIEAFKIQQGADAGVLFKKAEDALARAQSEAEEAKQNTLDAAKLSKYDSVLYQSRCMRADLLLHDGVKRPAEVLALFENAEALYVEDEAKMGRVWGYRIRALESLGKLDEAAALFENLRTKDPNSPILSQAAGVLARAFDQMGLDHLEKDRTSKKGSEAWHKAANYYWLSIQTQIENAASAKLSVLEQVAERLMTFGLQFTGAPEEVTTFVGGSEKAATEPQPFQQAVRIYQAALAQAPSYRNSIRQARCHGFLAEWKEAADTLARMFDNEKLLEPGGKGFQRDTIRAKPELISAYIDWGVAEHLTAVAEKDNDRYIRASAIFERVVYNATPDSKLWWDGRYFQIRSLFDRGRYEETAAEIRNLARTTNDYDSGRFGYRERLKKLEAELKKLGQ